MSKWDALIREHKSVVNVPLPLTLGSDLSGEIEALGPDVSQFKPGDEVYGVTNPQFCGAYAEYALASSAMIARKPQSLSHVQAASVPVVAVTAWQMLFDYAQVKAGQTVLIHGAAGNVGAYAVQLAKWAGAVVVATAHARDEAYVQSLRADRFIDVETVSFEKQVRDVDVVIDTVGGETQERSFEVLKPGGALVSSVSSPDREKAALHEVRGVFFLVSVAFAGLNRIAGLLETSQLATSVGEVLPLASVRLAHEMLGGKLHRREKIVLVPEV